MYDKIKDSLARLGLPFTENEFLAVAAQAESGHVVHVQFTPPAEFAEHQILEIWSLADIIDAEETLEAAHYEEILKENFTWPLGSWMLRPFPEGLGLCFSIKLISKDFSYADDQIEMAMQGMIHVVSSMQEDMGISPE
ncbi:hypothetical protein PQO03_10890 [Lentisphaera profundi]|uniref:Uncharacterized protein n=1 Tax=Lentisphaera profundi TaxID=1658616 RepID=A0ABY7VR74_9BACT|nr:hypothetical protein [Lentisphaera profundi]WDE96214.1 hypothetical protein PQO03_10890 [Lentisphaera profundi]